jgi:hypothetical protein
MKRAFKDIVEIIHQTDPKASFAIKFWDGDSIKIGDKPKFILKFKSLRGGKKNYQRWIPWVWRIIYEGRCRN